jgi:hypothetical protein
VITRPRFGLLRILGRFAAAGESIQMIPAHLLKGPNWEPQFKLASVAINLSQQTLDRAHALALADEIPCLLDPPAEKDADDLIFNAAEAHARENPAIADFVLRLAEIIPDNAELGRARCERLLRQFATRLPSDLGDSKHLKALDLPVIENLD